MREWLARVRDWLRRDELDAELTEELRFHHAMLARDARVEGAGPRDAADAARRRLGSTLRAKADARARWSIPWLDRLQEDVRHAVRALRRAPGFTAAVVVTLGLGIGANAAMFGVVDRLMLRPFPYLQAPDRVHRVYLRSARWNGDRPYTVFPYARYLDLARWAPSLERAAAYTAGTHGVGSGAGARPRPVLGVSASFFGFFDATPALGRFFGPAEDAIPTGTNVAVLGWSYWRTELGGRDVLGETIRVGSAAYTIVGVAPRDFVGVAEGSAPAVFVPITAYAVNEEGSRDYFERYSWDWTRMLVRRPSGMSREAASAALSAAFRRSWEASRAVHPLYATAERARPRAEAGPVRTAAGPDPGLEARTLVWVAGVAGVVLLVACANVANLLLARALRRRREVALRLALGVSRRRLAAQAVTESLVLALLGGGVGVLVARWAGAALHRVFLADGADTPPPVDWRTLGAALAAAVVAALLTAAAPVWFARDADPIATLRAGARGLGYRRSRARDALLVAQGALSVVLLVGAGLFARSLANVRELRLGYDIEPLLLARWERRGTALDSAGESRVRRALLDAALARPEVARGAWVTNPVFGQGTSTLSLAVPGIDSVARLGRFTYQTVSADYFATVGTRLLRGRAFDERDGPAAPRVVVVSEAMARALWPGREALGRCLRYAWRGARLDTMPCATVVGVAENALHDPVADHPLRYYVPDAQLDFRASTLLLRLRSDPAAAAEAVRRALQAVLPGEALAVARPAHELLDAKRRSWLVGATLFVALAGLALVVAAVGLYSVIGYDVAQRAHELGIRVALGARAGDVLRAVVGQGVRLAAVGVATGTALALAGSRWLQPLLFRQSALDPRVYGAVAAVLLAVAAAASLWPAARAARADPNAVLRAE